MQVAFFSAKNYEKAFFNAVSQHFNHDIIYFNESLNEATINLITQQAICIFVNDKLDAHLLKLLVSKGVKLIALRSAGFNHVDIKAAKDLNLTVVRVPAYSPYAVAEFAIGLMITLSRKIHRAYNRTREHNFSLDGLLGFDLHGKTVGIIGTGKIGTVMATILTGIGCNILANDITVNPACINLGVRYVDKTELYRNSDIITLHCPLVPETFHLIDHVAIEQMKKGVMLINTSRGAVVNSKALIDGLKTQKIGYLGLDVYEEEEHLFFKDLSDKIIDDETFTRLQTFPNVVITGHQAFFTQEAMQNIAKITLANITAFETKKGEMYQL